MDGAVFDQGAGVVVAKDAAAGAGVTDIAADDAVRDNRIAGTAIDTGAVDVTGVVGDSAITDQRVAEEAIDAGPDKIGRIVIDGAVDDGRITGIAINAASFAVF